MAHPIDDADWDIGMLVLVVDSQKKKIASRIGMEHTVETSPFYPAWVETAREDLQAIKKAIAEKDFETLGRITEHNGFKMHATTLSANPPFTYWSADSLLAQEAVRQVREELQVPAYMTMDAGPNVKVLCRASDMGRLQKALSAHFPVEKIISSLPGPAAYVLSEADWQQSKTRLTEGNHL